MVPPALATATSPHAAHCITNNPRTVQRTDRTDNQPATHRQPRTTHTSHLPLFRTAGHLVRTQHGVTASTGQCRVDVEVRSYLRDQGGSRSLVFDLSIAHHRFGSSSHVQQNGSLLHPQDLDCPMCVVAHCKTNTYKQTYADNQNISFLPAIMSTSN